MSASLAHLAGTAWRNLLTSRPSPLILLLEPSERCNAACPFCYHWRAQGPGPELSLREIERLLKEAWDLGCRILYLSGGEPTMHPDLTGILIAAGRRGYAVSLTSNGSLLAPLLPAIAPLIHAVTVSLDFAGEQQDESRRLPGLYRAAVDALADAARRQLPTRINMSLHRANRDQVEPLLRLAAGVRAGLHVRLLTCEAPGLAVDRLSWDEARGEAARLLALKHRHPDLLVTPATYFRHLRDRRPFSCRLLSLLLTIDAQGRVFVPCPKHEGQKQRIAGSIRERALADIWTSNQAQSLRRESAACTPDLDCYTSCVLDISLLAAGRPAALLEQVLGPRSLRTYFSGRG